MHNGPSQVVMKCTTLSVVHDDETKSKSEKAGEGRDLSQEAVRRNRRKHERNRQNKGKDKTDNHTRKEREGKTRKEEAQQGKQAANV
jgi:hypothetical protein